VEISLADNSQSKQKYWTAAMIKMTTYYMAVVPTVAPCDENRINPRIQTSCCRHIEGLAETIALLIEPSAGSRGQQSVSKGSWKRRRWKKRSNHKKRVMLL